MKIREATAKDFDDVVYIWSEHLLNNCQFFTTNEINNQGKLVVEKYLNNPAFKSFVLTVEDQVIGFSCIKDNEILFSTVEQRFLGKGFRSFMLKYLLENYAVDTAYVYSVNIQTLAFYTSIGFIIEDKIDDIIFSSQYHINKLKLSATPQEIIEKIAAKNKDFFK
ncbi:GNAT family N-acetyltransferase [Francisella tularensis]|uniref:GNAT family N-acetyltransferase n=1 Tax=Francisella tularensis TaxID=263 RepID=UPI0002E6E5D0|nr:GNAT family N-acetyltransferase [Francisella tularensis]KIP30153.1 acetyltransferase domain protein [Francisella tularensis subsp. holarctica]MBK2243413.1 GNAT family N-acetyltransferase [Francisella tularensis]MCC9171500.1 GNAT family N-acetyltransferase [Francisella tularensis]MWY50669.1 GNAT family N-acetyltransferase [Francisella tularensis]MXB02721.1 GNAT family N-acetyltransferase [Francisella tularensis]